MALDVLQMHEFRSDGVVRDWAGQGVGVYVRMRHGAVIIDTVACLARAVRGGIEDAAIRAERGIGDVRGVVEGRVEAVHGSQRGAREEQAEEEGQHVENALVDGLHGLRLAGELPVFISRKLNIPAAREFSLLQWMLIGCGSHVRCSAAVIYSFSIVN